MAASVADWTRRRRHPRVAIVALVIFSGALWPIAGAPTVRFVRTNVLPQWKTEFEGRAGGFRVRIDGPTNDSVFGRRVVAIAPDGSVALTLSTPYPRLGAHPAPVSAATAGRETVPADNSPGFGVDVDDDKFPDLVIECPTGGSGGALTTYVYRMEPDGLVPTTVLENAWIELASADGSFRAVGFDGTFAYRWTSGAGSPRPRVILKAEQGHWIFDREAMRALTPSDADLALVREQIASSTNAPGTDAWRSPLLRAVTGLLFAGKTAAARDLLVEQWRDGTPDLATFQKEFRDAFERSPYASELRALAKDSGDIAWP